MSGLESKYEVNEENFGRSLDYGTQANYFGTFESENLGKEVVWTPLYWAGKADNVLKFLNRQSYKIYASNPQLLHTSPLNSYTAIPNFQANPFVPFRELK